MEKILIVGSGASGIHFALSVLQKGYEVSMLDIGHTKPKSVNPIDSFNGLKANLSDPVRYFLGNHYEAVIYPDSEREYYGFPPNKNYIFAKPSKFAYQAQGFEPLFSFAQGGLAEAWTGGVYPLNDDDLRDFPFQYRDIEPYYSEVARRIGITGMADDLAGFFPWHDHVREPLRLDQHAQRLLVKYERYKHYIHHTLKCYLGRSRVATLSTDDGSRQGCTYCGRCQWGCPSEALYTPLITLQQCYTYKNFTYVPNMYVRHFSYDSAHRVQSMIAESIAERKSYEFYADQFVLAAGTLCSSKIFMESIRRETGKCMKLTGLMDNRQILVPFVNIEMIGKECNFENYQYHQIAIGIEDKEPEKYIHGQITTLKSSLVHPIIQSLPFDLQTAISIFKNVRAGLGVININLHDTRRENNYVSLDINNRKENSLLQIYYSPSSNEKDRVKQTIKVVKKLLRKLKCVVPPGMIYIRPMGASVHYAGTIPMSTEAVPLTSSKYCRSHDFDNLYIVDGSTFPFLPAKNLTFTLMANAVRVADNVF